MDNFASHSLKHVGRGETFGFSTLDLSNLLLTIAELMILAWGREIHMGLYLNEEPMEGNDVDD